MCHKFQLFLIVCIVLSVVSVSFYRHIHYQRTAWENVDQKLSIVQIFNMQNVTFKNLQLCYECEFAPITTTQMTSHGDYNQDEIASHWSASRDLYLFYDNKIPVGLCVVNHGSMVDATKDNVHDIAEFYITPLLRKRGYGIIFAEQIFKLYGGTWEIRQLHELEKTSRQFWLKVIARLGVSHFEEVVDNSEWHGFIQRFDMKSNHTSSPTEKQL